MIDKVWNDVKEEIQPILMPYVEVGCNICTQNSGSSFYIDNISIGTDLEVKIDWNIFAVGTFHTHVLESYVLSYWDIKGAVETNERFVFLGIEEEVYGVDLHRFLKSIFKVIEKKKSYKWLEQKILNARMDSFDY